MCLSGMMKRGCVCSWDVRLAALKGYYGQPKSTIFPFAYLNPGGYISNVTFWLNALKDYELGKVSHNTSARPTSGKSQDRLLSHLCLVSAVAHLGSIMCGQECHI